MRNVIVLMLLAIVASLLVGSDAFAAPKAATNQLPAALTAANVQPEQILTSSAAEQVRGEWLWICLQGRVHTPGFDGNLWIQGYARYFSMVISRYQMGFIVY
jgi:hypothetical protein